MVGCDLGCCRVILGCATSREGGKDGRRHSGLQQRSK